MVVSMKIYTEGGSQVRLGKSDHDLLKEAMLCHLVKQACSNSAHMYYFLLKLAKSKNEKS